jgi:hypothetical protein
VTDQKGSVMSSAQLYDTIGVTYTVTRRAEPRIAARVWGCARRCADGIGCRGWHRLQRAPGRDVTDRSFDAAMAIATVHHRQDPIAGLREAARGSPRGGLHARQQITERSIPATHDGGQSRG